MRFFCSEQRENIGISFLAQNVELQMKKIKMDNQFNKIFIQIQIVVFKLIKLLSIKRYYIQFASILICTQQNKCNTHLFVIHSL